jgi:hypothetical protein
MSDQVLPLFVVTCHCKVGRGDPLAAAVKLALLPAVIDWLDGWAVNDGAEVAVLTVSVAALLVAEPTLLVATQ